MTGANRERALVVKFGGSEATDENGVCEENLHAWFEAVQVHFPTHFVHAVFAIGGGQHVRKEQASQGDISDERKDQIGIEVLRGHAEQVQRVLARQGYSVESEIPQSPADAQTILSEQRQFAVALGGLQVGQSTDASAVTAAEIYQDNGYDASILILSNIWNIFTADPRKDDSARPISASSLATLVAEGVLLNDPCQFRPGMNVPLDPVAVHRLEQRERRGSSIPLWLGHMSDVESIRQFLQQQTPAGGTTLHGENTQTVYKSRE